MRSSSSKRTIASAMLSVLIAVVPQASQAARMTFAGSGVGIHGCVLQDVCVAPALYSFTIEQIQFGGDGSPSPYAHLCDLHRSGCTGVYTQREPLWTIGFLFDCWTVTSSSGGSVTMSAGKWFSAYDDDGVYRTRWWTFKIVDNGPGRIDQVGMDKNGPVRPSETFRGSPIDDGACGAENLTTSALIAGDFHATA